MEQVRIPPSLTASSAIKLSLHTRKIPTDSRVELILPEKLWVTPMGMLISCAALRAFDLELPDMSSQGLGYVRWMGWDQCLGATGSVMAPSPGSTYMPIRAISLDISSSEWRDYVIDTANSFSGLISNWAGGLQRRQKKNLKKWLVYVFRELLRNTPEHAEVGDIWTAAQFWPSQSKLEIAVLDNGQGVLNSLKRNPAIKVEDYTDALKLAVSPGVSSIPEETQDNNDEWGNSGFGLYVISQLARETDGKFQIVSGNKALVLKKDGAAVLDAYHNGTAIRMVINPSKLEKFDNFMNRVVPEGERLSNRRASKITRVSS